tara:strand:+ start:1486 stop:1638 length:153 start_codon:yes stop_codon:yes gene_type:complete
MRNDWTLEICFHWPHTRLALGWEFIGEDEEYDYKTLKVFLLVTTFTLDFK